MNELVALLEAAPRAAFLATVVDVEGSAYRRAGAQLLMSADGSIAGCISAGCLEADLTERARDLVDSGDPTLVTYDGLSRDEVLWGLGLGCRGRIDVLLEPVSSAWPVVQAWQDCLTRRQPVLLATVFRSDGRYPVGTRLSLAQLPPDLAEPARLALREERTRSVGGVLLQVLVPPQPLVICGGGPDAIPLCRMAKELGWDVTVLDRRPAFACRQHFPEADLVRVVDPSSALPVNERTAAVVMSHHLEDDRKYLRGLLGSSCAYIGVLGPRRRTLDLLGGVVDPRVHFPVGLDIGSETPAEIALSILAEIRAFTAGARASRRVVAA